tara:strand:- start:1351 stop:1725 length:375 start_codon:yes stop_codon:yes gene_type:complete
MSAVAYKSSILTSYYKMDNVLYEIRNEKGISINKEYDAWKAEVLSDLLQSGFIKVDKDLYTITEEGREVIQQDSFLYYNKRVQANKTVKADSDSIKAPKPVTSLWILSIIGSILVGALLFFLTN